MKIDCHCLVLMATLDREKKKSFFFRGRGDNNSFISFL